MTTGDAGEAISAADAALFASAMVKEAQKGSKASEWAVQAISEAATAAFREKPLAFYEDPVEEQERIAKLKKDDPITLQDAVNTSRALVDAVKEGDLEELHSVIENAIEGEFLQAFTLQAFVMALKSGSLPMVKALVNYGVPLDRSELTQSIHLVCEITTRDNFSDTWRIVKLLTDGNDAGKIDINTPRMGDGWTPLCVACSEACLPMVVKLLDFDADPNVITRTNKTPLGLAKEKRKDDSEEQQEARGIISNMLRSEGAEENWKEALRRARKPATKMKPQAEVITEDPNDGGPMVQQVISKNHTRFSA